MIGPLAAPAAIRLASAPVSYGVFDLTFGKVSGLPDPDQVLDSVRQAGYEGIDLGPVGYLGEGAVLEHRLSQRGLLLAGGWISMRFTDASGFRDDLNYLQRALDVFRSAADVDQRWRPKPTLADSGCPARRANPGRGGDLPEGRLGPIGWRRLADGVERAADLCWARGLEPTFHHHLSSYVETPEEIERLLELTEVGLCLDTGHLLLGGGRPLQALASWGTRINHVHLKDVRLEVLHEVIAERLEMEAVWQRGAFCELGSGDLDVQAFLPALEKSGYSGWVVVEQDYFPAPAVSIAELAAAQRRNRAYLEARGL
jgi:inosose dehydratase